MTDITPSDPAALIVQLQAKLIQIGEDIDTLPAKDIEATAKSIQALIASLEKADGYLRLNGTPHVGGGLSAPDRLDLLRRIRRMVENGVLDELDDA
jgi:hypothetical protein